MTNKLTTKIETGFDAPTNAENHAGPTHFAPDRARYAHSVVTKRLSNWEKIQNSREDSFLERAWKVICYPLSAGHIEDLSHDLKLPPREIFKHFDRQLHKGL